MAASLLLLLPPIVRAGLQSGTIMATADLFTQTAIEKQQQQQLDFRRTGRWAVAGLLIHGPYFYAGFRRLDGYFGAATSWKIVAQKTAAAQCLLFPPYLVVLFAYFGWTEQPQDCYGWHDGIFQKVRRCVPAAFCGRLRLLARRQRAQFWLGAGRVARAVPGGVGGGLELLPQLEQQPQQHKPPSN